MDRLQAMASGHELPARASGAILLADISGFTPLTDTLQRRLGARRGGEELTRHLNAIYRALVGEVHRSRGSVIGFSGDAMTCFFEGDDGASGASCGSRLLQAMRRFEGALSHVSETAPLAIKVAVTAGHVRRFQVGDPNRQLLDVLTGDALDRAAEADSLARPGELVVGREVATVLGDRLASDRRLGSFATVRALSHEGERRPWPELDAAALDVDALRPWVLAPVCERLRTGHGDFLAELRQATALFLRFGGIDFEVDAAAPEKLDAYVRWVQDIVARYEGSLLQLTTGDKGTYLYAAFGVPLAHEDAALRALSAALLLRTPPSRLDFVTTTQIGISRGLMRSGAYGSDERRTYGALGDETNVAARLMSKAAPDQILVSGRVAEDHAAADYRFEPLGIAALKGKEAMPLFALAGRAFRRPSARMRSATSVDTAQRSERGMIGRATERAALHEAADAFHRTSESSVILIEAEAGLGKSRLVSDLLAYVARTSPRVRRLVALAEGIEQTTSYFAWRSVFAELLKIDPLGTSESIAAHVLAALPTELAALSPLLEPVLEIDLPETKESAALPPSIRAARIPSFLVRAFGALAGEGPILLVVEDAHWLDSASWTLLELLRARRRVLLVVTTRPLASPSDAYEKLRRVPDARHLRLEGLNSEDTIALAAQLLGARELPAEVRRLVCDKAEGNPYFAEQLVLALRDLGLLRVEEGVLRIERALDDLGFPDTIGGVVTSRIDRLAPAQQLTLKVASVVGRSFRRSTLEDVFPVHGERAFIPAILEELTRLDFMNRDSPEPDPGYVFRHAVTRDVSYDLMLFEQRRALHETIADWYERAHAGDLRPFFAVLAHHRESALGGLAHEDEIRLGKAARALVTAGTHALESGATAEAVRHGSRALPLLEAMAASPARSRLELEARCLLGAALAVLYDPLASAVRLQFERARELCVELGEVAHLFEAVFGLWYTRFNAAERRPAIDLSTELLEIAEKAGAPPLLSLAHHAAGATALADGNHLDALAHIDASIAAARQASGSVGALAHARNPVVVTHCFRAWSHVYLGYLDRAVADVEAAMKLSREVAHPLSTTQAFSYAALVRRCRREPDEAETLVRQSLALAEEHGLPYWIVVGTSVVGWIAIERGDYEAGIVTLQHGLRRGREEGIVPIVSIAMVADVLDAFLRLGRLDEARAVLDEAIAMRDEKLVAFHAAEIHRLEGVFWSRVGDAARARRSLERALEIAGGQRAQLLVLRSAVTLAQIAPGDAVALDTLRDVVAAFPDVSTTKDMREAREILERASRRA